MLTQRARLVEELLQLNPTATVEFLSRFDDAALIQYKAHLEASREPRGRDARWARPDGASVTGWRIRKERFDTW